MEGLMFVGHVPIAYDWRDFINAISMYPAGTQIRTWQRETVNISRGFISKGKMCQIKFKLDEFCY